MKTHTAKGTATYHYGETVTITYEFTGRTFCGKKAADQMIAIDADGTCGTCRHNVKAAFFNRNAPMTFNFETGEWEVV